MCLILFSYQQHASYPLLVAANRDEFYERPAAPIHAWPEAPHVIAGRDLQAGGTWLGITRTGRFAALTNVREPGRQRKGAPSRGDLVAHFLQADMPPEAYIEAVARKGNSYNGFNLLVGDLEALWYVSNRGAAPRPLDPGLYGLSNEVLDTPWPKVVHGKTRLESVLDSVLAADELQPEAVLPILSDTRRAPDDALPDTGVPREWERILSAACIVSPNYGTRASTVVLRHADERMTLLEQTIAPGGVPDGKRTLDIPLVTKPSVSAS